MNQRDRSCEHYARVERERREGENFIDALRRVCIEDALADCEFRRDAARLLGLHEATLSNWIRKYGLPRVGRGAKGHNKKPELRKGRILAGKFSEYMAATRENTA